MKRTLVFFSTLIITVCSILACGQGSKPSPNPTYTPGPTPTPLPLQASGLEGVTVRSVCLEVEQSFPEVTDPEYAELTPHIEETTEQVLIGLGLEVVEDDCDAEMSIYMKGKPSGKTYLGAGFCFQGAEVNGEIRLALSDRVPLTIPMSGIYESPKMIVSDWCAEEPYMAPFPILWPTALLEGLAQLWGPHIFVSAIWDQDDLVSIDAIELLAGIGPVEGTTPSLIQILETHESTRVRRDAALILGRLGQEVVPALVKALNDESSTVREAAVEALGMIGPDAAEAVPALIQTLRKSKSARETSARALRLITGQSFGEDAKAWERWWEEQQ
jgi:hypothetical protein